MTLFVNLRRAAVGGGLPAEAYVVEGDSPAALKTLAWAEVAPRLRARRLLIHVHGFNVSLQSGVEGAVRMEQHIAPADDELFLAVLWPGDFQVPVINYSWEFHDAVKAGQRLAAFLDRRCGEAASVSLGSHSLGGRVVLEALAAASRRIAQMCVAAPAVDADVLGKGYAPALAKVDRLTVVSSESDQVLRWAYPLGDFFSDVFGDTDSPFRGALGLKGPRPAAGPPVQAFPIPKADGYDHGNYFPGPAIPATGKPPKWVRATTYWAQAMRGRTPVW